MSLRLAIISIAFLCSSCAGQVGSDKSKWKDFASTEAAIEASFPCNPKSEVEEYQYKPGKRFGYTFQCEVDGTRFRIMFGEHNPETGETVAKFLGYAEGDFELAFASKADEKRKESIVLDGFDAYRYELRLQQASYLALIAANEKGALTTLVGPFSTVDPSDKKRAERFLESIHFAK
jgi:hypothetical protein